jgi:hypothetical protein
MEEEEEKRENDYVLDYTADELYSMGEKRDYVPR